MILFAINVLPLYCRRASRGNFKSMNKNVHFFLFRRKMILLDFAHSKGDWSKFTGYICRCLGRICPKKVFAPFFSQKKISYPLNFFFERSVRQLFILEEKEFAPLSMVLACVFHKFRSVPNLIILTKQRKLLATMVKRELVVKILNGRGLIPKDTPVKSNLYVLLEVDDVSHKTGIFPLFSLLL